MFLQHRRGAATQQGPAVGEDQVDDGRDAVGPDT
jgi:hypothetical protein